MGKLNKCYVITTDDSDIRYLSVIAIYLRYDITNIYHPFKQCMNVDILNPLGFINKCSKERSVPRYLLCT